MILYTIQGYEVTTAKSNVLLQSAKLILQRVPHNNQ